MFSVSSVRSANWLSSPLALTCDQSAILSPSSIGRRCLLPTAASRFSRTAPTTPATLGVLVPYVASSHSYSGKGLSWIPSTDIIQTVRTRERHKPFFRTCPFVASKASIAADKFPSHPERRTGFAPPARNAHPGVRTESYWRIKMLRIEVASRSS